jgi:hypothetical protein
MLARQRGIADLVFTNCDHLEPAEASELTRVDGRANLRGVVTAIDALQLAEEVVLGLARNQVNVTAVTGLPQISCRSRAAVDDDALIGAVREIGGRVVGRII